MQKSQVYDITLYFDLKNFNAFSSKIIFVVIKIKGNQTVPLWNKNASFFNSEKKFEVVKRP